MSFSPEDEKLIEKTMIEYRLPRAQAEISVERRKVYGDPFINHQGIAMAWAGLLQPWCLGIAQMESLPPHVVALMMSALKSNRKRMAFHEDNYIDGEVYDAFARTWQAQHDVRVDQGFSTGGIVVEPSPGEGYRLELRWVGTESEPSCCVIDAQQEEINSLGKAVTLLAEWGVEAHAFIQQTEIKGVEWVKITRTAACDNPHAAAAIKAAEKGEP